MIRKRCALAFAITAVATAVLFSCDKRVGKPPAAAPATQASACDSITYSKHIEAIVQAECMGCHSAQSPNLSTYSAVKTILDNGKLKTYVIDRQNKPMPPSNPLPQAKLDQIQCWISNGGKEQ